MQNSSIVGNVRTGGADHLEGESFGPTLRNYPRNIATEALWLYFRS